MNRLSYLFQQYIQQTCSAEEKQELLSLMRQAENDEQVKKLMDDIWQSTGAEIKLKADRADEIFRHVLQSEKQIAPVLNISQNRSRWWWKIAVVVFAVAGISIIGYKINRHPANQIDKVQSTIPANLGYVAYTRNIILPDSSAVVLHANSTLQYPHQFTGNTREVTLIGEAYFDVKHNSQKPFIIHTGKIKTTVLGTAFNIKAYPGAKEITVSVTRGKVKVEDSTGTLSVLTPNQQMVYNLNTTDFSRQTVNAKAVTDWTKQDMNFESASMQSIADVLSKRYGVSIRFNNPALQQCLVTASFSGTETLQKILEYICIVRDATYTLNGNVISIDGKGCK